MRLLPVALTLILFGGEITSAQDPEPSTGELIASGRALLDARRPDEALRLFERAAERDASLATRIWVLRAWMDQGKSNDTLGAIDELRRAGTTGVELDYLYGMAFARRAQGHIAAGVTDSSIEMNFIDARKLLAKVVESDAERFYDAWLPLAESAWYTEDLELARSAGEGATRAMPDSGRAWLVLGRIALSQFKVAHDAAVGSDDDGTAEAHRRAAERAFEQAIRSFGSPKDREDDRLLLADAAVQLGHTRMWNQERARAADAYAIAAAWAPDKQDFGMLSSLFAGEAADGPDGSFLVVVEEGARRFRERFGAEDARDATLLWWLGWERLRNGQPKLAEQAFLDALAKRPDFVNAWFYVAEARYAQEDWLGAAQALTTGWDIEPATILAEAQRDAEANARKAEWLLSQVRELEESQLLCAQLAELCAELDPEEVRHWNNLGYFLRLTVDLVKESSEDLDEEALTELEERSLEAYEHALKLSPNDPQLLNDAAVMLHHYLERDLERAREMYERALAGARERAAAGGEDQAFWEQVAADAAANLAELP